MNAAALLAIGLGALVAGALAWGTFWTGLGALAGCRWPKLDPRQGWPEPGGSLGLNGVMRQ
jgi:hypothetical protein